MLIKKEILGGNMETMPFGHVQISEYSLLKYMEVVGGGLVS